VDVRLLVDGSNDGALLVLGGVDGSQEIQLQASSDLVLKLDLSSQDVGGGPSLSDSDTVLGVDPFSLDISGNGTRFSISETSNLEASGERSRLNLE